MSEHTEAIVIQPKIPIECANCGWTDSEPPRECTEKGGVHFTHTEPDVLERGVRILDETIEGGRADAVEVRAFVADAIAEIEDAAKVIAWLQKRLLAYTEAEPVRWEWKYRGITDDWQSVESALEHYSSNTQRYEVRALAVVAPKGDTEE